MATTAEKARSNTMSASKVVLRDVPWHVYEALRNAEVNNHIRMAYLDGTLELMSPRYRHEKYADRLGVLVRAVAEVLDIPCSGARSTTLRRKGEGTQRGGGKEPDTSFYVTNEPLIRDKDDIDLEMDPPPDLAIEVDDTSDSEAKLPIYAALGVPEVWRYDVDEESLSFGRLEENGSYTSIDRSVCLPMLTPGLVLDGLRRCEGFPESRWGRLLRDWVRDEVGPAQAGGEE